jgi:hypothetical protein
MLDSGMTTGFLASSTLFTRTWRTQAGVVEPWGTVRTGVSSHAKPTSCPQLLRPLVASAVSCQER